MQVGSKKEDKRKKVPLIIIIGGKKLQLTEQKFNKWFYYEIKKN